MLCYDSPHDDGARAFRSRPHRVQHRLTVRGIDERHHLAFVGHLQRVQTKNEQAEETVSGTGIFASSSSTPTDAARAISTTEATSPPRVGCATRAPRPGPRSRRGGQHRGDQSVQRGAVRDDDGAEVDALAHAHDRHAVFTEVARHDDVIARACAFGADVHTRRHHSDTRGIDEKLVGTPPPDHLGVTGDDPDPSVRRGLAHGLRDGAEHLQFQSFLQDEPGRQPDRLGAAARQVIDGAVDSEIADVAAGEEKRLHHIGIRRDSRRS